MLKLEKCATFPRRRGRSNVFVGGVEANLIRVVDYRDEEMASLLPVTF
jgi:hypothetical protein